eukprot:528778-Pyramimonas_sp.AAC.2
MPPSLITATRHVALRLRCLPCLPREPLYVGSSATRVIHSHILYCSFPSGFSINQYSGFKHAFVTPDKPAQMLPVDGPIQLEHVAQVQSRRQRLLRGSDGRRRGRGGVGGGGDGVGLLLVVVPGGDDVVLLHLAGVAVVAQAVLPGLECVPAQTRDTIQ